MAHDEIKHKSNCLICGKELRYQEASQSMECYYCRRSFESNAQCADGHFICDDCHSFPADKLIEQFCMGSNLTDPIQMAQILMRDERIKMHGPEHHFLVPAVLLSAYYNVNGDHQMKGEKIQQAGKRAKNVLGGFCGFYGACGAAVGTGIFISLVLEANPLSTSEWRLANLITAVSLTKIAELGGPRCCKRDTFLAIIEATDFIQKHLNAKLDTNRNFKCEFSKFNKECLTGGCPFYEKLTA